MVFVLSALSNEQLVAIAKIANKDNESIKQDVEREKLMDQEKILELITKVKEATKETQILYELTEAEMILFSTVILDLPLTAMSGKLLGRLLRAAAHFIERNEEIATEYARHMRQ